MGRQAFPIIGGIIGAAVAFIATDGTATWQGYEAGFAIGAAIGGIAGSYIDPLVIQGNKIGDTQLQVAAEGGARAIMFGQCCVTATCVIARGNRRVVKSKDANSKGSSGSTENETVTWTFAIGLGEAVPGCIISRVWQDENLVFDIVTGASSISDSDNDKFRAKFRFYDGNESQLPDADLQTFLGDDTPYFRGTAYVVFPNFDLTSTAERVPTFKFEILEYPSIIDSLEGFGLTITDLDTLPINHSMTLPGNAGGIWTIDLFLTGKMETRDYTHIIDVVGKSRRYVTASDNASGPPTAANVYSIIISDPPQTYYINSFLFGESAQSVFTPDGSAQSALRVKMASGATITVHADPIDGLTGATGQFFRMHPVLVGYAQGGNSPVGIADIVTSLIDRTGLRDDQFDVSELTEMVAGVCIENTVNGSDALNACIQPFFADPCERDGVLTWVKRGKPVVRTLTIDDLTDFPDIRSRENVIEYPAKVHFFYASPITGYATTKATSYRYSEQIDSSSEGSVTAPITFSESDTPAQIAQKLHKVMWTEAEGAFQWAVGMQCLDLIPSDVVGLSLRGQVSRARIIGIENTDGSLTLSLIKDRQSSYTSQVTGIPLPQPTAPQPTTMSKAVLAVLDIPGLQDTDDDLNYYTAMSGSTAIWHGAQLQRSLDSGATWVTIDSVTRDVTMGRLTVAMTSVDRNYTDLSNTITVQLFDPANELVGYSDTAFLQEQGAVAIQLNDGTWEVMQYRDAVDGGDGLWTLSHLQRGRLNTVSGAHVIGALFVLLSDSDIKKQPAETAWLGGTMLHRAVSFDTSSEDADIVSTVYTGRSQLEWSPASATAQYDGTFVYVSEIVARDRLGTEVMPIASVNFQGWRVTITDATHTVVADIPAGDSAHVESAPIVTPTGVAIQGLNKFTGAGGALAVVPVSVTAGSLTPVGIINGGGS